MAPTQNSKVDWTKAAPSPSPKPVGGAPDPSVEADAVADDRAEDQRDEGRHGPSDVEHHVDADEQGEEAEGGKDGLAQTIRNPPAEHQTDRGAHRRP